MIDFRRFGLAATILSVVMAPQFAQATIRQPGTLSIAANETATRPWSAPVGHRQPRATDFPRHSSQQMIDAEDASVDRKIGGVCRGC
jgi:hypothetical protein